MSSTYLPHVECRLSYIITIENLFMDGVDIISTVYNMESSLTIYIYAIKLITKNYKQIKLEKNKWRMASLL